MLSWVNLMPRAYLLANANNPSACVVGCSHVCEEICAENPQMWAITQAPRSPLSGLDCVVCKTKFSADGTSWSNWSAALVHFWFALGGFKRPTGWGRSRTIRNPLGSLTSLSSSIGGRSGASEQDWWCCSKLLSLASSCLIWASKTCTLWGIVGTEKLLREERGDDASISFRKDREISETPKWGKTLVLSKSSHPNCRH